VAVVWTWSSVDYLLSCESIRKLTLKMDISNFQDFCDSVNENPEATKFKRKAKDLCQNLLDSGKLEEVINNLDSLKCNENAEQSLFKYFYNLDNVKRYLSHPVTKATKSEATSVQYREDGNKYYQQKDLEKALHNYKFSIVYASHPPHTCTVFDDNVIDDSNRSDPRLFKGLIKQKTNACAAVYYVEEGSTAYNNLAISYANRSAVLMELGQYTKSISDINRAFELQYPNDMCYKILIRKAKCLIALKKCKCAQDVLHQCYNLMEKLQLPEPKYTTIMNSLNTLKQKCHLDYTKHSATHHQIQESQSSTTSAPRNIDDNLIFAYSSPEPPKIPDCNPRIPSLSSAVQMEYTHKQGRFMAAARDIKPGEVIGVEMGFVTCVSVEDAASQHTFCCTCLNRCSSPLPCPTCAMVVFCSETCRDIGLHEFHEDECEILPAISSLGFVSNCPLLALRVLNSIPYWKLKRVVPLLQQLAISQPRSMHGFNEDYDYDSRNYQTVFHL
ncbi:unnamed protein product, partial [Meganyctiphanes norvegica]